MVPNEPKDLDYDTTITSTKPTTKKPPHKNSNRNFSAGTPPNTAVRTPNTMKSTAPKTNINELQNKLQTLSDTKENIDESAQSIREQMQKERREQRRHNPIISPGKATNLGYGGNSMEEQRAWEMYGPDLCEKYRELNPELVERTFIDLNCDYAKTDSALAGVLKAAEGM